MIISNVTSYNFHEAFNTMRPDQFSYEALEALYDYLEEMSYMNGAAYVLDVIALCCEWSEYSSLEELQGDYNDIDSIEDLDDKTMVLGLDGGGLVIQQF